MKLGVHKHSKVTEPDFSGKILFGPNLPKSAQNRVYGILCKIGSLVFARNCLKRSVLLLSNFLRKPHVWEKSGSQDMDSQDSGPIRLLDSCNCYIFWTVWPFFVIFCIKIEYHNTFRMMQSFFSKNSCLAQIGQNWPKMA